MAFDVSAFPAYTDQTQTEFLVRALYTGKTASILDAAGQVIPGIKTSKALPIIESTIALQADGCGDTISGSTTFSVRSITVAKAKVREKLCAIDLETKWTQIGMKAGAAMDMGIFSNQIGSEKAASLAEVIELTTWTGATSSAGKWDGFCTILTALGFGGAGDPVEGNQATAGGWTQLTSLTAANIDGAIANIYARIPARVLSKTDVVCFMGEDSFRLALLSLKTANLFHYTPEAATEMTMVYPGTNIKLIGVPGLNGTNKMVAGSLSNFWLGTDLMNEEESFKIWYSEDLDTGIFQTKFKYGAQIAFPAETVYFVI